MNYTEMAPFTKKPVHIARHLRDRKLQRALMQFFKPENYFEVRKALEQAARTDLIGGCEGLIPNQPTQDAIQARRQKANKEARGEFVHTVPNPNKKKGRTRGYRPKRKSVKRRERN